MCLKKTSADIEKCRRNEISSVKFKFNILSCFYLNVTKPNFNFWNLTLSSKKKDKTQTQILLHQANSSTAFFKFRSSLLLKYGRETVSAYETVSVSKCLIFSLFCFKKFWLMQMLGNFEAKRNFFFKNIIYFYTFSAPPLLPLNS